MLSKYVLLPLLDFMWPDVAKFRVDFSTFINRLGLGLRGALN